jgi:hypothetical protein
VAVDKRFAAERAELLPVVVVAAELLFGDVCGLFLSRTRTLGAATPPAVSAIV